MSNLDEKDYKLIEAIAKWQNKNEKETGNDWCFLSKESLGKQIGLSRSNTIIHLNHVIAAGYITRNSYIPKLLKVTTKWYAERLTSLNAFRHS